LGLPPGLIGAALIAVLSPCVASATLGETENSVAGDAQRIAGSIKIAQHPSYRVHEIDASGTVVREFVGGDGTVFAVAWHGPTTPNLHQMLGAYFDRFVAAQQQKSSGHTHVRLQQSDLVVEVGGHMRAFSGRVYLPAAMPGGVDLGDLH
jgi:hypothetical protein